jgi:hypothetical protein
MRKPRRERQAAIRLTEPTYQFLREQAAAQGLTFAEYARLLLVREHPHLRTLDDVWRITNTWRNEADTDGMLALYRSALERLARGQQELATEEAAERDGLTQRYERARAELAAAERELQERLTNIGTFMDQWRELHKRGLLSSTGTRAAIPFTRPPEGQDP